jgi:hypothetical protein
VAEKASSGHRRRMERGCEEKSPDRSSVSFIPNRQTILIA